MATRVYFTQVGAAFVPLHDDGVTSRCDGTLDDANGAALLRPLHGFGSDALAGRDEDVLDVGSAGAAGHRKARLRLVDGGADAGGRWGTPRPLPPPINSDANEYAASMTADGGIYFSSSRDGAIQAFRSRS